MIMWIDTDMYTFPMGDTFLCDPRTMWKRNEIKSKFSGKLVVWNRCDGEIMT